MESKPLDLERISFKVNKLKTLRHPSKSKDLDSK